MKYEVIISIARALIAIIGGIVALGLQAPIVSDILDALNYIVSDSSTIINALVTIEGIIITIASFFLDPMRATGKGLGLFSAKRFNDRVKGLTNGCNYPECKQAV